MGTYDVYPSSSQPKSIEELALCIQSACEGFKTKYNNEKAMGNKDQSKPNQQNFRIGLITTVGIVSGILSLPIALLTQRSLLTSSTAIQKPFFEALKDQMSLHPFKSACTIISFVVASVLITTFLTNRSKSNKELDPIQR